MDKEILNTPPREAMPRFHADILEIINRVFPGLNEVYTRRMVSKVNNWKTIPLAQLRLKLLEEFCEYNLADLHDDPKGARYLEARDVLLVALFIAYREKECLEEELK